MKELTKKSISIICKCIFFFFWQVQLFHGLCCRFIDSLPPHAKFHARELLTRLLSHSQSLKTFNSSSPSAGNNLLSDIQTTNRDIMAVVQRWKFQMCRFVKLSFWYWIYLENKLGKTLQTMNKAIKAVVVQRWKVSDV